MPEPQKEFNAERSSVDLMQNKVPRTSLREVASLSSIECILKEIRESGSSLNLPAKVISESEDLCVRAIRNRAMPYDLQAFIAACITAACKINRVAMTPYLIVKQPHEYLQLINGMVTSLKNSLDLDIEDLPPMDYLPRFFSEVENTSGCGLETGYRARAFEILELSCEKNQKLLSVAWPDTYAAAAIYIAAIEYNLPITHQHIWKATGITSQALSKRCKEISGLLNLKANPQDKPKPRASQTLTETSAHRSFKNYAAQLKSSED